MSLRRSSEPGRPDGPGGRPLHLLAALLPALGAVRGDNPPRRAGFFENPAANSTESGLGVISGWICDAATVEIAFENVETGATSTHAASFGTSRGDTLDRCGDTDNGFGLLINWNLLGNGEHIVRALVDGEELGWSRVTVTTLGEEFPRGLRGRYTPGGLSDAGRERDRRVAGGRAELHPRRPAPLVLSLS